MIGSRKKIIVFVVIGLIAGFIYPVFADSHEDYLPFINGILTGLIGSVTIGLLELYYFDRHWGAKGFKTTLLTKTFLYTGVLAITLITVKVFNESLYYQVGFWSYLKGEQFQHFLFEEDFQLILLYALAIIGFVFFINQLSLKMGPGVLWNIIWGKYHKPKKETVVLLYIDLKSSTRITEKLGAERYHHFINRFYQDISGPILSKKGKVYRYVGDQITIFWNEEEAFENANCIQFYLDVKQQMRSLADSYQRDFGQLPDFRACCHMGELVVGQIGDVKSQIVFHGEALYICEMIEKKCKELNEDFLVSDDVHRRLEANTTIVFREMDSLVINNGHDFRLHAIDLK
ncbi:MAG: adenylate/guanylate cyclase domain-containing protein [Flavobacteriaceae bacterium]